MLGLGLGVACNAYKRDLLQEKESPDAATDGGSKVLRDPVIATGGRGIGGSGGTAVKPGLDGGPAMPDGGSACVPNPDTKNQVCPLICTETCNGADDDCDRRIDEDEASTACKSPNTTAVCKKGACLIVECSSSYRDCNRDPNDGCESDVDADQDNCGTCGTQCMLTNALAACVSGQCAVARCEDGYDDCDAQNLDCERKTNTLSDCGACGTTCGGLDQALPTCASGSCAIESCIGNHANCDGEIANGCEQSLDTLTDCGACGVLCPNASCAGGMTRSTAVAARLYVRSARRVQRPRSTA
jgi:hypothetical protein